MIILFLLIVQILLMLSKSKWNKGLVVIIIIATTLNVGFLTILHFELLGKGTFTYGSDESVFYETMLNANRTVGLSNWFDYLKNDFNFTYILFGALILKTSWFDSIYLIRLGNVLLFLNVVVMIYLFLKRFSVIIPKSFNLNFVVFFIATNGVLIWTAIRNLKDTLFIYALIIFVYLLFDMIFKKRFKVFNLIIISISIYVLTDIRQWFLYFLVLLLFVVTIVELLKRKRFIMLILAGGILSGVLLSFAQEGLEILRIYTLTRFSTGIGLGTLPMLMGQFIIGPGPIRGLFGDEAFLFTTTTGNVLITLGSLAWWLFLPLFSLALLSWKNIKENYIILTILLFYWATYAYANMGSGDTRIRAIFYILCVIYTLPYLDRLRSKDFSMKYIFVLIPIVLIGAYFSYRTLV